MSETSRIVERERERERERGVADAIFAVRQRMEKQGMRAIECLVKKSGCAIGRRDCQIIVMIVQDMYEGVRTRAKANVHGQ